jgi:hypothetical protein
MSSDAVTSALTKDGQHKKKMAGKSMKAAWPEIWTAVEKEHTKIKAMGTVKQTEGADGAVFCEKKIYAAIALSEEKTCKNIAGNVAWSIGGTECLEPISMLLVDKYVDQNYVDKDHGIIHAPGSWPGPNIPICCPDNVLPPAGTWERFGADLAHAAYWRAMQRSMHQGGYDEGQAARFHRLGCNVPHDFRLVRNKKELLSAAAELADKAEQLREFFGLDLNKLIKIAMTAKQILLDNPALADHKNVNNEAIAKWLSENISWKDRKRAPGKDTVGDLIKLGEFFGASPRSAELVSLARAEWGRDTLFDEASKLLIIVNRAPTIQKAHFAFEFLFAKMKRLGQAQPDKTGKDELKSKASRARRAR